VQLRRSPTPTGKKLWLGWRRHRKRTRNAWNISKGSCRFCIRDMANIDVDLLRRQLDRIEASGGAGTASADGGNGAPPPPGSWLGWRASVDARLDGLKGSVDGMRWVISLVAVVMIGGFSFFGLQLSRLEGRVDRLEVAIQAIPARLSDEFRAMRSEMAAQTNAIANSITATRQAQPPPPQIIVLPAPQPAEKPAKP
jgi:hypothetical protein